MKPFKNNLRMYRIQAGMTFEKLGACVGLSKSHLWGLEQPEANPTLSTAYLLSAVLNVSVTDIWPSSVEIVEKRKTTCVRTVRGVGEKQ